MTNNQKAFVAACIAFIVAAVRFFFNYELPGFALEILSSVALGVAGLFLKSPAEKKS